MIKKITFLSMLFMILPYLSAQITTRGALPVARLEEILHESDWVMRIIEIGPGRGFLGTITEVSFGSNRMVEYRRSFRGIRGQFRHDSDPSRGTIRLFNQDYRYEIRGNRLFYFIDDEAIPLLERVSSPDLENIEAPRAPHDSSNAILEWLNQNSQPAPTQRRANQNSQHFQSELIGSHWRLLDRNHPIILPPLTRELNWRPVSEILFEFGQNGSIIIEANIQANGQFHIGATRSTTVILSYTNTGWNRVIGQDRLIRLDLRNNEGTRQLFHLVSDDGISIFPVTIRRMGENEPSYVFVNRTNIMSFIPRRVEEE